MNEKTFKNKMFSFLKMFKKGSIGTKLSFFIMGSGNIYHKQYIKGFIFLTFQILFNLFMFLSIKVNNTPLGFKALKNLLTLGSNQGNIFENADDSRLMLLFGLITIAVIIFYNVIYIYNIKSSYKSDLLVLKGKKPPTFYEDIKSLLDERFYILLLIPSSILVIIFTILPTIFMILIAFTDFGDPSSNTVEYFFNWVGFKNFKQIFMLTGQLSRFPSILIWTFIWAFLATFSCYFGGILLALLINKKGIKFKKMWRTIFILTIAVPQFVSLLSVRNILGTYGPFNQLLINFNFIEKPIEFLGNVSIDKAYIAKISIIVINFWIGVPYTMLMTSGILLNIPKDLYEAATIDGANKTKMFRKITFPYILFVTGPYLISSFVGNITSFNIIYLLTGGNPSYGDMSKAGATDLLVTWLYKLTIDEGIYNIGSIISIMTFLITASITLIAYRNSKSYKQEDTFQ